jgi:hypothetical protein
MDPGRIHETLQTLATKTAIKEDVKFQAEKERQERNAKAVRDHDAQLAQKVQTILKNRLEGRKGGLKHHVHPKTNQDVYTISTWTFGRVWGSGDEFAQQTYTFLQSHGLKVQELVIEEVISNNNLPPEWFGTDDGCVQFFWVLMTGGIPLVTRPLAAIADAILPRLKIKVVVTKA